MKKVVIYLVEFEGAKKEWQKRRETPMGEKSKRENCTNVNSLKKDIVNYEPVILWVHKH